MRSLPALLLACLSAVLPLASFACDNGPDAETTGNTAAQGGSAGSTAGAGAGGGAGSSAGTGGKTSSGTKGLGYTCATDADCASDMICGPVYDSPSKNCSQIATACTRPCSVDSDCADLGDSSDVACKPACGPGSAPECARLGFNGTLGEPCDATKACSAQLGLSCRDLLVSEAGGCKAVAQTCSKACDTDADCDGLAPNAKCFGCGGTKSCGLSE